MSNNYAVAVGIEGYPDAVVQAHEGYIHLRVGTSYGDITTVLTERESKKLRKALRGAERHLGRRS